MTISGPFMMEKARALAERLGVPEGQFKVSSGWLERFKERNGVSFKRVVEKRSLLMSPVTRWKSGNVLSPSF